MAAVPSVTSQRQELPQDKRLGNIELKETRVAAPKYGRQRYQAGIADGEEIIKPSKKHAKLLGFIISSPSE